MASLTGTVSGVAVVVVGVGAGAVLAGLHRGLRVRVEARALPRLRAQAARHAALRPLGPRRPLRV